MYPAGYQFHDINGHPVASGSVYYYSTGTETLKAIYSDKALSVSAANPVSLDAAGRFTGSINIYGSGEYSIKCLDSTGATVFTRDSIFGWGDGAPYYERSASEIVAGVTPDSYAAVPGSPWRYGQGGTSGAYADGLTAAMGVYRDKLYNGTVQTGAGYQGYHMRLDTVTEDGVDVGSTVGFASIMQAYSTNTGGTATSNNTNQVAGLFNASAMDATASVGVYGLNAIAVSNFTGAVAQTVVGAEIDLSLARTGAFYASTAGSYAIGLAVQNVGSFSATVGVRINTSTSGIGWLHGIIASGLVSTGFTVARNTVTPHTGVWVSAAGTYGVYVGAKELFTLESGSTPAFDANHNPTIGIALGQRAATSGDSNKLRFISTDSGSDETNWDVYNVAGGAGVGTLEYQFGGSTKIAFASLGRILVNGTQVVSDRQTGWSAATGTATRTTFATTTVTTEQLAQRVKALIDDLSLHGLIGA
jgi:hypothetical protein